jgi:predicted Rossmann-fold nucleotide-binding protein
MKRITVFCGSSAGIDSTFMSQAALLGQALAKHKIELVYGGAVGLMGAVADGVLNGGGTVIGVIPDFKIKRNRSQWIDGTNCRR